MDSHTKSSSKASKPRISFVDKSLLSKSSIFPDDIDFVDRPDFISCLIKSKKESEPQSAGAPIVKQRLINGYRIVNLQLENVEDALKLIKVVSSKYKYFNPLEVINTTDHFIQIFIDVLQKHCIETDPMCRSIGLSTDVDCLKMLDYILLRKITDWCSFCAIDESTGKLVGVIIGSLKRKNDLKRIETRMRPKEGQSLFYLMMLNNCLISKFPIYERFSVENYIRIYALCVKMKHRGKGIGQALVRTVKEESKELGASVCVGVFFPGAAITIGKVLGFIYLGDISFKDALVSGDEDLFEDDVKKYKLSCMTLSIEKITQPQSSGTEISNTMAKKVIKKKIKK